MKYVLDTNVLMQCPDVINNLSENGEVIVISVVLRELDKLKMFDGEVGAKARGAVRALRYYKYKIFIDLDSDRCIIDKSIINDDKIMEYARHIGATLVSGDFVCLYKAEKSGLKVIDVYESELYTGVRRIYIDEKDNEAQNLYILHKRRPSANVFGLKSNEYLIIYDKNSEYKNGNYKRIGRIERWDNIKNGFVNIRDVPKRIVTPKNDLQACAIDLAFNDEIPIKILAGTFGSGKTLIGIRAAEEKLDREEISQIMCIRNPIGSGKEIGFIKGGKEEKIGDFFKAISSNMLGSMEKIEKLKEDKKMIFEIPFYMKGMSIMNSYMVVDEAEDLTVKEIKLVGSRVGERSCVCFCGDYKQAEQGYMLDNGLVKLINGTKDDDLVGCVVLEDDVRSEASKVFANLM